MSYLDVPRMHFAGNFSANVSTVNNTAANYDPTVTNPAPAWNPGGSGTWQLLNCTVQSVCYSDGTRADSSAADPIIGAPVAGTDTPVAAKLVDLDTEQQLVSEIWGFQVRLGPAAGPNTVVGD